MVGDRTFAAGCDSSLHVLSASKGQEISSVDLGGQVGATAAVLGNFLYVGTMSNQVLAVDWKKSEVAWRFEPTSRPKPFFAPIAVGERLVIAGCRNKRVYALDRLSGKEVWSFLTEDDVESGAVIAGARVYVGSKDRNLYVLDLNSGKELARHTLEGPILAAPAIGSDCLVVGESSKGIAYCFGAAE